jgi:hypothetical protein
MGRIILDNGSTFNHFKDEGMVENIRESSDVFHMVTNAGSKVIKHIADVPGFGKVRFDKDGIANSFSFHQMAKLFQITYDSEEEDSFFVHMPDGIVKFEATAEGLYALDVSQKYLDSIKKTKEEVKASTSVGESYLQETVAEKNLVRANMIKDCPVSVKDINIAEQIFGPSMSVLKGKSRRKTPKTVMKDSIEIPKELMLKHYVVELCIDTMYINQVVMNYANAGDHVPEAERNNQTFQFQRSA